MGSRRAPGHPRSEHLHIRSAYTRGMVALLRYLPFILAAVLLVAALVDVIRIDPSRVRGLPKPVWALIVVLVAFFAGREPLAPRGSRGVRPPVAPDDDPEFLRRIALEKEQQERIRDLERRLADLDKDADPTAGPAGDEKPKP